MRGQNDGFIFPKIVGNIQNKQNIFYKMMWISYISKIRLIFQKEKEKLIVF